jgi:hypothetical protein
VLNSGGSGVGRISVISAVNTTASLSGAAKFYTDAAGTLGESTTVSITAMVQKELYFRLASGTARLGFNRNNVTKFYTVYVANSPYLSGGDIGGMTTLTDVSLKHPSPLIFSIAALVSLTTLDLNNNGVIVTGSLNALTSLVNLLIQETGQLQITYPLSYIGITGDLSNCVLLEKFNITDFTGHMSFTGDLSALPLGMAYFHVPNCTMTIDAAIHHLYYFEADCETIVTTVVNALHLQYFQPTHCDMTAAQVNQVLADMWANRDETKLAYGDASRIIDLGSCAPGYTKEAPTGQGLLDKVALAAYRSPGNGGQYALWTVITN